MSYLHPQFGSVSSVRTVSDRTPSIGQGYTQNNYDTPVPSQFGSVSLVRTVSERTPSIGQGYTQNNYDTPVPSRFGSVSSFRTVSERTRIRPCQGCTQNNYDTPVPSQPARHESDDEYDSIEQNGRVTRRCNGSHIVNRRYVRTGDVPVATPNGNEHWGVCVESNNTAGQIPWKRARILERSRRRNTIRCIVFSVTIGFAIGVAVCLTSWLFMDKLKHANICCEIKQETNVNGNDSLPNSDVTKLITTENITGISTIRSSDATRASPNAVTTNFTSVNFTSPYTSIADVNTRTIITTTSQPSVVDISTYSSSTSALPDSGTITDTTTTVDPISPATASTFVKSTSAVSSSSTPNVLASTSPNSEDNTSNDDNMRRAGGHVYTRWGSFECPEQSEQIYKGYMAGGHYSHPGGATNTICLPEVPEWGNYSDGVDTDRAPIYGTEYGSNDETFNKLTGEKLKNKDVPCIVCQATGRTSYIMMPAKKSCLPNWTQEYKGYLMGSAYLHNHASQLVCVDSSPDHVANSDTVSGGNFLYFAEIRTGILPHLSYVNGREIPCIICTK